MPFFTLNGPVLFAVGCKRELNPSLFALFLLHDSCALCTRGCFACSNISSNGRSVFHFSHSKSNITSFIYTRAKMISPAHFHIQNHFSCRVREREEKVSCQRNKKRFFSRAEFNSNFCCYGFMEGERVVGSQRYAFKGGLRYRSLSLSLPLSLSLTLSLSLSLSLSFSFSLSFSSAAFACMK